MTKGTTQAERHSDARRRRPLFPVVVVAAAVAGLLVIGLTRLIGGFLGDARWGPWSDAIRVTSGQWEADDEDASAPDLPAPRNVAFEATGPETIEGRWDPVAAADVYQVRCNEIVQETADTSVTISGLEPGAHYDCRVRAGITDDTEPGPRPVAFDYYASPDGSGDGSAEDPFQIEDFWEVAEPGDALGLLDGDYTGSSSMIEPPDDLSGTPSRPITVAAVNDGAVFINGEEEHTPIDLRRGNSWFVIEGVNAHDSDSDVVRVAEGSNHNVLRRIVAWNADDDRMVYRLYDNEHTLLEDTAGFGSGRKIYQTSALGNHNTFRRAWAMWNMSEDDSVKQTFSIAYESKHNTCENCIGTYDADSGASDEDHRGILSNNSMTRQDLTEGIHSDSGYWGSIAYLLEDQEPEDLRGLIESFRIHDGVVFRDVVAYVEHPDVATSRLRGDPGQHDKSFTNVTEIGPGESSVDTPPWRVSNRVRALAASEAPSIWNGTTGATVCHRYENRKLTSTPLWPWPMDNRIRDALVAAGRDAVVITDLMEELFGEIPPECRNDR